MADNMYFVAEAGDTWVIKEFSDYYSHKQAVWFRRHIVVQVPILHVQWLQ
jgi:hypothetical protein